MCIKMNHIKPTNNYLEIYSNNNHMKPTHKYIEMHICNKDMKIINNI